MSAQRSTYAKQARIRIRSTAKLIAFLAGAAAVTFFIWGYGWYVSTLLAIAGFFGLVMLFEWVNARVNEKRAE